MAGKGDSRGPLLLHALVAENRRYRRVLEAILRQIRKGKATKGNLAACRAIEDALSGAKN